MDGPLPASYSFQFPRPRDFWQPSAIQTTDEGARSAEGALPHQKPKNVLNNKCMEMKEKVLGSPSLLAND